MLSYREIRTKYQDHPAIEVMAIDYYAKLLSPLLTQVLLWAQLIPNQITVLMMLTGVLGAALFAMPSTPAKVAGIAFIHLWYLLDCSDGEVARITRRFSKFGKEIDYTAHVVNHPLFNLAFALSLVQAGRIPSLTALIVCTASISAEMVMRNLMAFKIIQSLKVEGVGSGSADLSRVTPRLLVLTGVNMFLLYPTFAMIFPILHLVDGRLGTAIGWIYLLLQTAITGLVAAWSALRWVRAILNL